jgi:hypothetical protein
VKQTLPPAVGNYEQDVERLRAHPASEVQQVPPILLPQPPLPLRPPIKLEEESGLDRAQAQRAGTIRSELRNVCMHIGVVRAAGIFAEPLEVAALAASRRQELREEIVHRDRVPKMEITSHEVPIRAHQQGPPIPVDDSCPCCG